MQNAELATIITYPSSWSGVIVFNYKKHPQNVEKTSFAYTPKTFAYTRHICRAIGIVVHEYIQNVP